MVSGELRGQRVNENPKARKEHALVVSERASFSFPFLPSLLSTNPALAGLEDSTLSAEVFDLPSQVKLSSSQDMEVPHMELEHPQPMTLREFCATISQACLSYNEDDLKRRQYRKVRVLCVCYEADKDNHPNVESTSERVRDIFQNTYGYDTVGLMIRKRDKYPQATLNSALRGLLSGMEKDCLAILHYIGHGGQSQKILFPSLRDNVLNPWEANVLIIFDCCCAVDIYGDMIQRKELMYAFSPEENACHGLGCERGLSSNLIQQLRHAHESGHVLSTSQLYSRLAAKSFAMKDTWQPELESLPQFMRYCEDHGPSLLLQPLDSRNEMQWIPVPIETLATQPADVVLSVQIENAEKQTLNAMQSWIQRHPLTAGRVRVDELYKRTDKCIVAVTFQVWYNLPDHPAILPIGFEFKRTTGH
ncbi:hypothetical protein FBEOM_355 [Fusarium beomiforme]|uniref:Caspase n=1 Tax=Fusarium beomiforme TaxID=44412 RepID=A0A9P5B050_9HYPO|nr:hypothetical protein FBEOM_355 [Fusarium beomiforme]